MNGTAFFTEGDVARFNKDHSSQTPSGLHSGLMIALNSDTVHCKQVTD